MVQLPKLHLRHENHWLGHFWTTQVLVSSEILSFRGKTSFLAPEKDPSMHPLTRTVPGDEHIYIYIIYLY